MAMPPGNVVIPDKVQYPAGAAGGGGGGNEIHQHHLQRYQWFPVDERDGFISWLRGEFAAANAIIDSLCHHLRVVGEAGEYDLVVGCIQQRRSNWNHVLHMQQYFSVGEVIVALQQAALRRQQQQQQQQNHHHQQRFYNDQGKAGGKDFKRSSSAGFNRGHRGGGGGGGGDAVKEGVNSSVENHSFNENSSENIRSEKFEEVKSGGDGGKSDDKKEDATAKPHTDNHKNSSGNAQRAISGNSEAVAVDDQSSPKESDSYPSNNQNEKQNLAVTPKTFVAEEMIDGQKVNVVDGLKLYEKFLDGSEVSKLVSLVNELRAVGRRGKFQGQTYILSKRPMKGHGREMIQLGLPIADAPPEDDNATGTSKDRRVESIPALLQDVIERFVGMQVMTMKPDSCIIDIYNEGDHSQPHLWPPWFGKPVSVLFLTECELTFGKVIETLHHGDYRGSLKLSVAPGSFLVMQGKSSDVAKHAIPMIRKQRVLITFTKSQPKKHASNDSSRLPSHAVVSSQWGPLTSRSPNHLRHPVPKHYATIPTTGVLPVPPIRPQIPPPNGVQPLFMTTPVAAPMPFPTPVPIPTAATGWPTASPRHPAARLPVPIPGTETGESNHDTSASPEEEPAEKTQRQDSNGVVDGTAVTKEEQKSVNHTVAGQSAGAE
ncbi:HYDROXYPROLINE-RICH GLYCOPROTEIN FAMILY PROTEIN-RELATED [Salix koriyanagi]|uniref:HYDROXYPROLINE-RICH GLYCOPROTEIN FAMILY PROTEIN-RELATED n=1 Tax=Salix koriyanagi TaxID=2511006 RepID=A0A9Q0WKL4_9ROSI|nr:HYDROXYPROLINE-RICH GLYCOPROTEIN FAMILY PROTEIN-RELATED [Salix koriyanagi]